MPEEVTAFVHFVIFVAVGAYLEFLIFILFTYNLVNFDIPNQAIALHSYLQHTSMVPLVNLFINDLIFLVNGALTNY